MVRSSEFSGQSECSFQTLLTTTSSANMAGTVVCVYLKKGEGGGVCEENIIIVALFSK